MQAFIVRSSRTLCFVVCVAALAGASLAHAQKDDRRVVAPDGKPAVNSPGATSAAALVFTIDVRWLDATPYRMTRDVTGPIERAVKTLPGVTEVHSSTTGSRSQTHVYFSAREDASKLASAIRERLDQIRTRLPRAASQPLIGWRREPPH